MQYIVHCTPLFQIFLISVLDVCEVVLFIVKLLLYIVGYSCFALSQGGHELHWS